MVFSELLEIWQLHRCFKLHQDQACTSPCPVEARAAIKKLTTAPATDLFGMLGTVLFSAPLDSRMGSRMESVTF